MIPEQTTIIRLLAGSYTRATMIAAFDALAVALLGTPREVARQHAAEYRSGYPTRETVATMRRCWAVAS